MTKARQIAITKRVSLSDLSEGWEECYALVRPATYQEYREFADVTLDGLRPPEVMKLEMDIVMDHFISGRILVFDADGKSNLEDMQPEDVEQSLPLAGKLFFEILGVKPNPKGSAPAA